MSLYQEPIEALLGVIEQTNNIVLDREDYDLGIPVPEAPPAGSTASYNTRIRISANNVAAAYQGFVEVLYNRLNLAELAQLVTLSVKAPVVTTSHDLVPVLNNRFGLNLKTEDIVLVDATDFVDYKTVVLTATDTSIGWIGSTEVQVSEGDIPLEDYLTVTELPGIKYPTEYVNLPFANFYSYWRDFTAEYTTLSTVVAGGLPTAELAAALTRVTGDAWQHTGYGEYSLGSAEILFAGLTQDEATHNPTYTYGIVIRLSLADCTAMTGDLVIHFNEPVDSTAV